MDTGATVSAVERSCVDKEILLDSMITQVKMADGTIVRPAGEVKINVEWKGQKNEVTFLVLDKMPYPVILGTDWIAAADAVVYYSSGRIQADRKSSEEFENFLENRPNGSVAEEALRVKTVTIVQPSSVVFVPMTCTALLGGPDQNGDRLVHRGHCEDPKRTWVLPNCIVAMENGECMVPVINPGLRPVRFYPGEEIATSELMTEALMTCAVLLDEIEENGEDTHPGKRERGEEEDPEIIQRLLSKVPAERRESMRKILLRFMHLFYDDDYGPLRTTTLLEHHIDTGNAEPIHFPPFHVSPAERERIRAEVEKMLRKRVAKISNSPWASRVLLIPKPDGTPRFCIDLRALNRVTVRDMYPLPRMDDILSKLGGSSVFSQIDLKCGYWQLPLDQESQPKTAFVTPDGLYECTRLPMGLHNGGASFQRLMDLALGDLKWTACLVYLDDLVVMGRNFEEHQRRLMALLTALEKANLTLNPEKCVFAADEISCLGHRVSGNGAKPNPDKIQAIVEFPSPNEHAPRQRAAALRSFIGMVSYYRNYIVRFAEKATPLYTLLKKGAQWDWGPNQEEAFTELKNALVNAPVLVHPLDDVEMELQIDASQKGLGAALLQPRSDGHHPIAFVSRRLTDAERNYHSNELECLTLVWALRKFRHYLFGRRFVVKTDNNVVRWLCSKKDLKGKFARWMMELQEYDFQIHHLKGVDNVVADALSRYPVGCDSCDVSSMCVLQPAGYSTEELALWQQGDPSIKAPALRLQGLGKEDERKQQDGIFRLSRGVLYKINISGRGRKHLLVVPSILRRDIVKECHDSPTGGHFGIEKTWSKLNERYWWPSAKTSVVSFVSSCSFCQFHKRPRSRREGELHPIEPPKESLAVYGIDHIGPLPKTTRNNQYILVAIDLLSKWVIADPVPNASTGPVVTFLQREIIAHHGIPKRIISDWGTAFTSIELEEALNQWGIVHSFAYPAYPRSNGQVERANASVVMALKAYIDKNQRNWDELLPGAVMAINTAKQSSTGLTPFEIIYGRKADLPHERLFPWPAEEEEPHDDFVKRLTKLKQSVRDRLKKQQRSLKEKIDKKRKKAREYKSGDLVLVARDIQKKGKAKKFLPRYVGPYQVVKRITPVTYLVEDVPARRRTKTWRRFPAHVSQLKPFRVPRDDEWEKMTRSKRTTGSTPPPTKRTKSGREVKTPTALKDFQLETTP